MVVLLLRNNFAHSFLFMLSNLLWSWIFYGLGENKFGANKFDKIKNVIVEQ